MNTYKRIFSLLLVFLLALSCGCKANTDKTLIVTIHDKLTDTDTKLYMKDFLYDIYLIEVQGNSYDTYYKETLGYEEGYWNYTSNGQTMRDLAKTSVYNRVTMYEILSKQAAKEGLSLTEEEISANKAKVDELILSMSEEDFKKTGLSETLLLESYNRILLGDKLYQQIAKGFTIDEEAIKEGIDPDDYRQYKTEYLFITTISGYDNNMNPISLSEEEMETNYNHMCDAKNLLKNKKSMKEIASEIPELTYNTHDFVYGETTYVSPFQEVSKDLDNDEYSDIVQTGYGFLLIHMLDNNSDEAYQAAIKDAIKDEENAQFEEAYNKILNDYDITTNDAYWDNIVIGTITTKNTNE